MKPPYRAKKDYNYEHDLPISFNIRINRLPSNAHFYNSHQA